MRVARMFPEFRTEDRNTASWLFPRAADEEHMALPEHLAILEKGVEAQQEDRDVIDTVTGKGVLKLGRFTGERKAVLDGIRDRLRDHNFVPMVFDWDKPSTRDLTETVHLLANMSRFVVADITDAKSIPQELMSIVPHMPSAPIRPIILSDQREYAMFEHFKPYPWVLPVFAYNDRDQLLDNIVEAIISPVIAWESKSSQKTDLETQLQAEKDENARLRAALNARISQV